MFAGCANRNELGGADVVAADDPLQPVAFLAGTWRTAEQRGTWTEEHWTAPACGSMLGGSRTIGPGADGKPRLKFFEYIRIAATREGVDYLASPRGRSPATPFKMVPTEGGEGERVVFENPEHDFPTRVVYWLEKDGRLHGRIEGRQNGVERAEDWIYERIDADAKR